MAVLEGEDDDAVMEQMEAIAELAEDMECLDILVGDTPTMKRDMWAAHDAFHTSMESGAKNSFEYNITVPAENIAEMVEWAKALAEEKGLKALAYAHVCTGGMHIHIASDGEKDEFKAAIADFSAAVYEKCAALGGDIRGEYGIGYAKTAYLGENVRDEFKAAKAKLDNFEKDGDIYKVKTFKEITKLERNGLFVYESVPGTAVMDFEETADTVTFTVEGPEDAQITLGLEEETEYEIDIAGAVAGTMKTNLGGKLSLSVELEGVDSVDIKVSRK